MLLLVHLSYAGRYVCDTLLVRNDTTVVCTTFHSSGQVTAINSYLNGKLHGTQKSWYKNGQIESMIVFRRGILADTSYAYYKSGALKQRTVQTGITISLYENGDTLTVTTVKNGRQIGRAKSLYPYGTLKSVTHFNDSGKKHGLSERWREDGTRKDSIVYDNGDVVEVRRYYDNGKLRYYKRQKAVNRDINAVYYDPHGKKCGEVKNGTGTYISYSDDGKSARRVYFENDEVKKHEKVEIK